MAKPQRVNVPTASKAADRLCPRVDGRPGPRCPDRRAAGRRLRSDALRSTGSGAARARPVLTRLLGEALRRRRPRRCPARSIGPIGEPSLGSDRGSRATRGSIPDSIRDPIDTSTPQGMFFPPGSRCGRAARERRRSPNAPKQASRRRGRAASFPGNPGPPERRPEAIKAVSKAREKLYLDELIASAQTWLPMVRGNSGLSTVRDRCRAGAQSPRPRLDSSSAFVVPFIAWSAKSSRKKNFWPDPLAALRRTI